MKVKVYGKLNCPECKMLLRWLDENNVSIDYYDVGRYPDVAERLYLESGNASLPQYCYEGQWHYGFDLSKLRRLFKK